MVGPKKRVNKDYVVDARDCEIEVDASCRYSLWTRFAAWLKNQKLPHSVTIKLPPARGTGLAFKITKVDSSENPVFVVGDFGWCGPIGLYCITSSTIIDVGEGTWDIVY